MGNNLGVTQTQLASQIHSSGVDRKTALKAATFAVHFSIGFRDLREGKLKGNMLQGTSGAMGVASSTSSVASSTSMPMTRNQGLIQGAGLLSSELGSDFSAASYLAKGLNIVTPARAALVALSMLMEKTMAVAEIATPEEQNACSKALANVATDGVVILATSETIIGALLPAAALALHAYDAKLKCMADGR